MAKYTIIKNSTITIDPVKDFADTGWTVSNNIGYHDGCNAGRMGLVMDLSKYQVWNFSFNILDMTSGAITIYVDGVAGTTYNDTGVKTVQFTNSNPTALIEFYSNGKNAISYLQTYPQLENTNSKTYVFNEDENIWGGEHSYQPEFYHKFLNSLFSFKDGYLWEHDVNPIKNNFYNVQYSAKLKVVANELKSTQKRYLGIKIESNNRWGLRNITILPNEYYPNGMKSMLHENNFHLDKGEYVAGFLRDMLDPQFNNQADAIFEGRELEGKIIVLEMECLSTQHTELRALFISSVEKFSDF